jgi:hypothetical protein
VPADNKDNQVLYISLKPSFYPQPFCSICRKDRAESTYKIWLRAIILRLPMSDQSAGENGLPNIAADLLDPYEKLVSIEVLGSEVNVPEKNRLLRCFQYLSINTISYGDFCWNGECTNCQVWFHMRGQDESNDRPALSCRLECTEGMVVTKLSRFIELEGIT